MTASSPTSPDPRRLPRRTPRAPGAVRWIVRTLEGAGHDAWTVGGAVRDSLLGLPGKDWDLATSARPGEVQRLFPRTVPVGVEHGTVGVLARDGTLYEVTTFRRDVETDGRHAVVAFADTVEEDLARRDFTINAIAWHPLRREFLDPFGGVDDLEAGVVRTVGVPGDRFAEDHLRVLRALRFAARFGMAVERETWGALVSARGMLLRLSPERVRDELLKVLQSHRPSAGLALYEASGVGAVLFPELALGGAGDDRWTRRVLVADALSPRRPLERLAALLVEGAAPGGSGEEEGDAGKTGRRTQVEGALRLMERLRFSNAQVREVAGLVDAAAVPPPRHAASAQYRRWLARTGREPLRGAARIWIAGARVDGVRHGRSPAAVLERIRALRAVSRSGAPLSVEELALDGRDLIRMGLRPGPHFRRILDHLLDRVLVDPGRNTPESLEESVRGWLEREGADV